MSDNQSNKNSAKRNITIKNKSLLEYILITTVIILCIAILFTIVLYFKHYAWSDYSEDQHPVKLKVSSFNYNIISHIDIAGVFVGIVGIFIGVLIYIIVERGNKIEKANLQNQLQIVHNVSNEIITVENDIQKNIADVVLKASGMQNNINDIVLRASEMQNKASEMQKKIEDIVSRFTSLRKIDNLRNRFKSIKSVIDHAENEKNSLTIMTYMTSYGSFLVSNVGIAMHENNKKIEKFINDNQKFNNKDNQFVEFKGKQIYSEYFEKLAKEKEDIPEKLLNFISNDGFSRLRIGVLGNDKLNSQNVSKPSKLRNFIKDRVLKNKRAFLINNKSINNLRIKKVKFNENLFIYSTDKMPETGKTYQDYTDTEILDFFCDELINNDATTIENLENTCKEHDENHKLFYPLDYIPFQFFLSSPSSRNEQGGEWKAIVIFTNFYNIGFESSIASFETENKELCEIFLDIFDTLCKYQSEKEQNPQPLKYIFNNSDINFFMNKENLLDSNANAKLGDLISIADINAKEEFISILKNHEVSYCKYP